MAIDRIDHLVLTVRDVEATCAFYQRVLGMTITTFGEGRKALQFGRQKINLHEAGSEFAPAARRPTPGSADFCLIAVGSLDDIRRHVEACGVLVEEGPVRRSGALGPMTSIYLRDPDGNLLEVSTYDR